MKRILLTLLTLASITLLQAQTDVKYICPPCGSACDSEVHEKRGVCPHCNMILIREDQSKTIAFYLQDGVEILDFAGPMEVFSYSGYRVFTVSKTKEPIRSQGILSINPDYSLEDAPDADILAFFGGNANAASSDPEVIKWIQKQENIEYHFSVCTGAFVLAESGLLDGKSATTFHNALNGLERNYPKVKVHWDARFVDNGEVITTAGISAGIDGALHLVAKLQGLNAARRTAYYMEYDNWVPGDGLILSEDNPYTPTLDEKTMGTYTGTYEYRDNGQLSVSLVDGILIGKSGNDVTPVYHEFDNVFSDVFNNPIYFKQDEEGNVTGYSFSPEGEVFEKLD